MVDLQKDLCQHPVPLRTAAASAPVPFLLDLFSPRLKKNCYWSINALQCDVTFCCTMKWISKNKILMEILLYMIARLFTERVNKVLVLILDFYHLLFSTFFLILWSLKNYFSLLLICIYSTDILSSNNLKIIKNSLFQGLFEIYLLLYLFQLWHTQKNNFGLVGEKQWKSPTFRWPVLCWFVQQFRFDLVSADIK